MDKPLSHSTAFTFYRVPPIVLSWYEDFPDLSLLPEKHAALKRGGRFGPLSLPVDVLVADRRRVNKTKTCRAHVWSSDWAPGMIQETNFGFPITTPLFTLLSLAESTSAMQLVMMLYEIMGSFAVYRPSEEERFRLQNLADAGPFPVVDGWRPMLDNKGRITSLWQRPPLATIHGAREFVSRMTGMCGVKRLRWALDCVWGVARSPFEVQTAMLLGLSRRNGGYGLGPFELNKRIRFSPASRSLAQQNVCYVDLFQSGTEGHAPIAIECQGAGYHGGAERNAMDDNRALALQSMGITVVRLRYEQICDAWRLQNVARYIAGELGMHWAAKSEALEKKELELRANVLIDWWTLGH